MTLDLPPDHARHPGVLVHGRRRACWPAPASTRPRCRARCTRSSTPAIGMLPLFTICDRWDVGGVSTAWLAETGGPTIVIYDGYPGGAGIAELGFDAGRRHLEATLEVDRARARATPGCPSCVQSPKCGNLNEPLDKAGRRPARGCWPADGAGASAPPARGSWTCRRGRGLPVDPRAAIRARPAWWRHPSR